MTKEHPLTIKKSEAARLLGVSVKTIENWISGKVLSATKVQDGRRGTVLLNREEVLALVPRLSSSPTPNGDAA